MTSGPFADMAKWVAQLRRGDRRAVAAALNLLDDMRPAARDEALKLLTALPQGALWNDGHLIGITGPPGVGKSTLISALIAAWRIAGLRVAVLAVDPSSRRSGGALLGDRLRMGHESDEGVFIRSLAGRDRLGGISREVWPMSRVLLLAFDVVVVETVGVGQNEVDVTDVTDTTVFVAQPGGGDTVQFLKAGILETPHVLVVNKADLGPVAERTMTELHTAFHDKEREAGWRVPVLAVSSLQQTNLNDLVAALNERLVFLRAGERLPKVRRSQQIAHGLARLVEEFGKHGLAVLGGEAAIRTHWEEKVHEGRLLMDVQEDDFRFLKARCRERSGG